MKNIDIVIPVSNVVKKNNAILFTLKSILDQKRVDKKIYIVNDGSEDDIENLINNFFEDTNIMIIHQKKAGVARARNNGASIGKSELILFIDDDTVLSSDYTIKKTIDAAEDYDFACAANRYWTPLNWDEKIDIHDTILSTRNILNKISYIPKGVDRETGLMDLTHLSFIGNYGFIKRNIFEKMGGFPEHYKGWGMEDTHLMYNLCINNFSYRLLKYENISVYHLNHKVSKNLTFLKNYKLFVEYQKKHGFLFSESAFLNEYDGTDKVLSKI